MQSARCWHQTRVRAAHRGGLATLELVLVFPILLALAALIFGLASASIRKSEVAAAARREAWEQRRGKRASDALILKPGMSQGQVSASPTRSVSLPAVYPETSATAESRNTVLAAPWDDPDIEFGDTPAFIPHTKPLAAILQNAVPGLPSGILSMLDFVGRTLGRLTSILTPIVSALGNLSNFAIQVAGGILLPVQPELYDAATD